MRPTQPKTFVSGQAEVVGRSERRKLAALASSDPDPQVMYEALIKVNNGVARRRSAFVSRACFTTHVRLTGESGAYAHNPENRASALGSMMSIEFREVIRQQLDKEYGPGRYRFVASSGFRSTASEEFHASQLREKPNDANAHCNYGAFLQNQQKDIEGAEREYRKAIELDGNHANAVGNLANIMWQKGDIEGAAALYKRALDLDPGENLTWNYARFLEARSDRGIACQVLDRGITAHPESGRLLLLRGQLALVEGAPLDAVDWFKRARDKGADQAAVEAGYACALQMGDAPVGECIAAYLVSIGLAPKSGILRLNLAQLMFLKGDNQEADKQLSEALRLGLDNSAQLEAQFYLLCHTSTEPEELFHKTKALLSADARLRWNVRPNIEVVRKLDPQKASVLEIVREVMAGERNPTTLDELLVPIHRGQGSSPRPR